MATFDHVTIRQLKELADQFKKNVDGYVEEVSQSILKAWESSPKEYYRALRFLKQPMPTVEVEPQQRRKSDSAMHVQKGKQTFSTPQPQKGGQANKLKGGKGQRIIPKGQSPKDHTSNQKGQKATPKQNQKTPTPGGEVARKKRKLEEEDDDEDDDDDNKIQFKATPKSGLFQGHLQVDDDDDEDEEDDEDDDDDDDDDDEEDNREEKVLPPPKKRQKIDISSPKENVEDEEEVDDDEEDDDDDGEDDDDDDDDVEEDDDNEEEEEESRPPQKVQASTSKQPKKPEVKQNKQTVEAPAKVQKDVKQQKNAKGHFKHRPNHKMRKEKPQGKKIGAATSQIQPQIAKGESDVTQKQGAEGEANKRAKYQTTVAKAGNLQALALPPKSARLIQKIKVGDVKNALYDLEGDLVLLAIRETGLFVYDDKGNQLLDYIDDTESISREVVVLQGHEVAFFKSVKRQEGNYEHLMVILNVTKDYIQEKAVYDLGGRIYNRVATLDCKTLAAWGVKYSGIDVLDHTGKILQKIAFIFDPQSVCKSHDGNLLITAWRGTRIYKYDRQTGSQMLRLQVPNVSQPGAIFYLPCGSNLVIDRSRRKLCLLGQDLLWKADIWNVPTEYKGSWQNLFVMGDICLFSKRNNVHVLKLDQ